MHTAQSEILKIIFSAVLVLGFVIFYFIYTLLKQQKKIIAWQEERIKAEVDTLEGERKRIAEDLHDDIGPMLSAIKLQVSHVEPADEHEKKIIEKSGMYVDEVIKRFREIAYDLLPNILIRKGLITAVKEFTGKMNDAHDLKIRFIHDENVSLPTDADLNLYRIVQEITHNAIKHAQAKELAINLHVLNNQILFTATDNGKGFIYDEQTIKSATGLGLLNIQNRVTLLKGKLSVKSEPDKGTSYYIAIPLVR